MAGTEGQPNPSGESGTPDERYKNLQRQLEKARTQNREVVRTAVDANAALATAARTEELMLRFMDSESPDLAKEGRSKRTSQMEDIAAQHELTDILAENDVDWQDERLAEARDLWGSGKRKDAVSAAADALGVGEQGNMETVVAEAVRKALGVTAAQVDTGTGVASGSGPITRGAAREMVDGNDSDALIGNAQEFLNRVYTK
tara:strand:- start:1994 stop:2599 length:606 start_codon:yes stop_codon:yes gene_type:complete